MTQAKANEPAKYIVPLNMNRLEGRMLRYPARKRSLEILLVGDYPSNIEYWWGLIRLLHDYGSVTMGDLPGLGGMDDFYKINKQPTLDNYADYLASFIKLIYKRRPIVILGIGFGFVVITRMLQNYPEMTERVKCLVSLGGYTDHDDFNRSKVRYYLQLYFYALLSRKLTAKLISPIFNERFLTRYYLLRSPNKSDADIKRLVEVTVKRWLSGNLRTMATISFQLGWFSNTAKQVNLPLVHVQTPDELLSYKRIEQRLRVIYAELKVLSTNRYNRYPLKQDKRSAGVYLPSELRQLLKSL